MGKAVPAFYPDFLALSLPLYAELPDLKACRTGRLRVEQTQHVLDIVNKIRQLHGLGLVSHDIKYEQAVSQAALMFAANGQISHAIPTTWRCYSAEGANAAANSIIRGGIAAKNITFYSPEQDVIAWLTDVTALSSETIGHRRLLLDPFLRSIAYGRVSGRINARSVSAGSALKIIGSYKTDTDIGSSELIAYPYHDYPARYFVSGSVLSLSLLIDKTDKQANASVDFSKARVTVTTETGKTIRIRNLRFDNLHYGLPNSLQFKLASIELDLRYHVSLDGVVVHGQEKSYRYWFRIMPEIGSNSLILK